MSLCNGFLNSGPCYAGNQTDWPFRFTALIQCDILSMVADFSLGEGVIFFLICRIVTNLSSRHQFSVDTGAAVAVAKSRGFFPFSKKLVEELSFLYIRVQLHFSHPSCFADTFFLM